MSDELIIAEDDGNYDEILDDEILETTEMIWDSKTIPFEKYKALGDRTLINGEDEIDMRAPFEVNRTLVAVYNLFPLNPWMVLWISPLNNEVPPALVDRISVPPPIASHILYTEYSIESSLSSLMFDLI